MSQGVATFLDANSFPMALALKVETEAQVDYTVCFMSSPVLVLYRVVGGACFHHHCLLHSCKGLPTSMQELLLDPTACFCNHSWARLLIGL